MKEKPKKGRKWVLAIFFLAAIAIGIYGLLSSPYTLVLEPSLTECPIEFGTMGCFEHPVVPFFNPNEVDLTGIQVLVPKANGVDIYNIDQSLKANTSEVLTLQALSCPATIKTDDLKVRWCCGKCYESLLSTPSSSFNVTQNQGPQNQEPQNQTRETYPQYPKKEDCLKLKSFVRNLCLDDAAELSGDVALCALVDESDWHLHCTGRLMLNESMCTEINDTKLKEGCLESIALKRKWASESSP